MEYFLTQLGIGVFAITGVLSAAKQRLDIFSIVLVGLLTALGGGTLRDVILDLPVFWLSDLTYFWVAVGASCLTFVGIRYILKLPRRLLSYLDAMGVALVSVQVIEKTLGSDYPPTVAVVMGIVTGIAGGILRDVVTQHPTLLLSRELYATPILIGSVLYILLLPVVPGAMGRFLAMAVIFGLRAAAIRWQVFVPLRLTLKVNTRY
jgi:uncharacterized membrane protein YeiH